MGYYIVTYKYILKIHVTQLHSSLASLDGIRSHKFDKNKLE